MIQHVYTQKFTLPQAWGKVNYPMFF